MAMLNQYVVRIRPGELPALLFTAAWQLPATGEICAESWLLHPEVTKQNLRYAHHFFGAPSGIDAPTALEATLAKIDKQIEVERLSAGAPLDWGGPLRIPASKETVVGLLAVGTYPGLSAVAGSYCIEQRAFVNSLPRLGKIADELTVG